MYHVQMLAEDVHAALGRLMDQARLADIRVAAVAASAVRQGYVVRLTLDTRDGGRVEVLSRRVAQIVGVTEVEVERVQAALHHLRGEEIRQWA